MKKIILAIVMMSAVQSFAATMDPACEFIDQTMIRAREILEVKDQTDRTVQLCALLTEKLGTAQIADQWLGQFANLAREQVSIDNFKLIVPSIMMTKALPVLGAGGTSGTFEISPAAVDRGNGVSEVTVTVKANGKTYVGFAIVQTTATGFALIDAEYMGFSAVDYQGREYQKFMTREYNKDVNNSMPVSALVQLITTQDDYVSCP